MASYKHEAHINMNLILSLSLTHSHVLQTNWQSFGQPDGFLKPKVTVIMHINIMR